MSKKITLASENIELLFQQYNDDPHFTSIVMPRLLFLNQLVQLFDYETQLDWQLHYSPVHKASNCVRIQLKDERGKFSFYYEIPLMQRFEFFLFLGNNTFNFFEAYPLLINKQVITEGEYDVKATSRILPHLDLNKPKARYDRALLNNEVSDDKIKDSQIYNIINNAFLKFNTPLFNIIHSKWLL